MNEVRHCPGWQQFKDLEHAYRCMPEEQRAVDLVTAKLTKQFAKGQAVSQVSKNPKGGMYGRVLEDNGGDAKVHVLTRSGAISKCTREYLNLYEHKTKQ